MKSISFTYDVFKIFEQDKFSFVYQGYFANNIVMSAVELIGVSIKKHSSLSKIRHKLSYLMIESFQNITRYADEPKNKKESYLDELFMVRNIKQHFYIVSANIIHNSRIDYVKSKLVEVNTLDHKGLNSLYQEVLTNNQFTEAGGAGLGFIEMVRKTKEKLDYDFVKINDEYSYFYLLIKIKSEKGKEDSNQYVTVDWVKNFHAKACENKLVSVHKGNFSPVVIDPVLNMVEKNIKRKSINIQKLAFHLIIESLQNVSHHSLEMNNKREAIFMICKKDQKYHISTGNFMIGEKAAQLQTQLNKIKSLNKNQLKRLYDELIHKRNTPGENKTGLGLVEIAIESNNRFYFDFIDIEGDIVFYIFAVEV